MTIANRLRRLLSDRGFSVTEAAEAAGMKKQQVSEILTGHNANPGLQTIQRIVEAVGGTMEELFAEDENEDRQESSP